MGDRGRQRTLKRQPSLCYGCFTMSNIFNLFSGKPPTLPPASPDGKIPYQAYTTSGEDKPRGVLALRIGRGRIPEQIDIAYYCYLSHVLCETPTTFHLMYTDGQVLVIDGESLDGMVEPLQDHTLRSVQCFNPDIHIAPASAGEPLITSICYVERTKWLAEYEARRKVNAAKHPASE